MTKTPLAVLFVTLCAAASGAAAQTFESAVAEASAAARRGAEGVHVVAAAEPKLPAAAAALKPASPFAKVVDCRGAAEYYFPETMRFYIRLDDKSSLDEIPATGWIGVRPDATSPKDEAKLDDYGGVSVNRSVYSMRQWSCDTQDYDFTLATPDLVRRGNETSRAIKVRAHVETRGQTDFDGDLSCTAWWVTPPPVHTTRDRD